MSQIKEIITTLLNSHERGSIAYLEKYIHLASGGKVSQAQSKQYAQMLMDYNDYLDDRGAYEGVYASLFDSFDTDDFATGIGKFIETSGLGKFEDGDGFARGLFATEEVLEFGADIDEMISHYNLPETDMIQDEAETGINDNHEPHFDIVLKVEDAYSERDAERLYDYSENQDE